MTRKTFAALAVAGLIALAGLAVGLRPSNGPAATAAAEQAGGASVETTVLRRTKYVHSKNRSDYEAAGPGDDDRYDDDYAEQSSAPRPATSASGDGEDDDDHGSESKRDDDSESKRDDAESDREDDDDHGDHLQTQKHDDDGEDD